MRTILVHFCLHPVQPHDPAMTCTDSSTLPSVHLLQKWIVLVTQDKFETLLLCHVRVMIGWSFWSILLLVPSWPNSLAQNRVCAGTSEITLIKLKLMDSSYIIIKWKYMEAWFWLQWQLHMLRENCRNSLLECAVLKNWRSLSVFPLFFPFILALPWSKADDQNVTKRKIKTERTDGQTLTNVLAYRKSDQTRS